MTGRDLQTLADEYVVGLLDEAEIAAVERQLASDPALEQAVIEACERFLEVDLTAARVAAQADGWQRIVKRLNEAPPKEDADVIPFTQRLRTDVTPSKKPWRATAFAAMAASALLAVGLGWQVSRPAPLMIAVLLDGEGDPRALVEAFADDRARVIPLGDIDVPAGQTLEVWTLPDVPDAKPVSLGQIDRVRSLDLQGPDLPVPQSGQLYEITIEQEGGSPTGLPTGPIVGKGFAKPKL